MATPLPVSPSMAAHLPLDIISNILSRLPVELLLQLKCVCKSWQTLISSLNFAYLHLRHSLSSNFNRLLIFAAFIHKPYPAALAAVPDYNLHIVNLDLPHSSAVKLPLPKSFENRSGSGLFKVIGSCNGLMCIMNAALQVILLNPSTRHFKLLKPFPENALKELHPTVAARNPSLSNQFLNFCFGYDAVVGGYKVVFILEYVLPGKQIYRRTMVYNLITDSWRIVSDDSTKALVAHDSLKPGVLVANHLLHWKNWFPHDGYNGISCFDICNETWSDVPLPYRP